MAKSKVPVARIEGAGGRDAAQEKPQSTKDVVVAASKAALESEADVPSAHDEDAHASVAQEIPEVSSEATTAASDKTVAAEPTQGRKSDKLRTKVVVTPKVEVDAAAVPDSADTTVAKTAVADSAGTRAAAPSMRDAADDAVGAPESSAANPATKAEAATTPDENPTPPAKGLLAWLVGACMNHSYAVLGGLCGLVVALLVFFIGFWKTLFICLLVLVGVMVGQYLDGDPKIVNFIKRLIDEARGNN